VDVIIEPFSFRGRIHCLPNAVSTTCRLISGGQRPDAGQKCLPGKIRHEEDGRHHEE